MRSWSWRVAVGVLVLGLAACGSTPSDPPPDGGAGADPHVPTASAEVTPRTPEGREVRLGDVASLVVSSGATVEERETRTAAHQMVVRFGEAPLKIVEVTWAEDDPVSVDEQTWTAERTALTNAEVSDYVRARVEWPGATQAVLATWREDVANDDGSTSAIDAARLVVQDAARTTVAIVAVAPEGELEGSDVEDVLLSLTLG